jgi:hypothetical protein
MPQTHFKRSVIESAGKFSAGIDVDQTVKPGDDATMPEVLLIDSDGVFSSQDLDRTVLYLIAKFESLDK